MRVNDDLQSESGQQSFDPVGEIRALGLQVNQLAVDLPPILVFDRRNANYGPDLFLTVLPADEHRDQLAGFESI